MCDLINLNKLELVARQLGYELVIELVDGRWIITENILDSFAFQLPIQIGSSESEAEVWLTEHLSETAGE